MHLPDLQCQLLCLIVKTVQVPAVNHPQETIYLRECSKKSHGKNYAPYRAGGDAPSVISGSYGR